MKDHLGYKALFMKLEAPVAWILFLTENHIGKSFHRQVLVEAKLLSQPKH